MLFPTEEGSQPFMHHSPIANDVRHLPSLQVAQWALQLLAHPGHLSCLLHQLVQDLPGSLEGPGGNHNTKKYVIIPFFFDVKRLAVVSVFRHLGTARKRHLAEKGGSHPCSSFLP